MSASLVGSEMCIRDRGTGPCLPPSPRAVPLRCRRGDPGSGAPGAAAVSYTHLTLPTICSV
eukprot:6807684-Alexandrium_andersonii.AAC.1